MSRRTTSPPPCITIIAGPNGGGKSSLMGALLLQQGADYFNPDTESRRIATTHPGISMQEANSLAWRLGKNYLERAIQEGKNFTFETTLGGNTISGLLERALDAGLQVRIWFVSLSTPELHIERVRARVAQGGHDIPKAKIRERFERGRANLIRLMPKVTELRLFDNSFEADPSNGKQPQPKLILHFRDRKIVAACQPSETPAWAKPIVETAIRIHERLL